MANWLSSGVPQAASSNIHFEMPFFIPNNTGCPPELLNPPPWASNMDGFAEEEEGRGSGSGGVTSASRNHCEAEKRRRDRINAQLSTLRKLIPVSDKMDKAALLSSVVEHVKEMKKKATEISKMTQIPTDKDEVLVEHVNGSNKNGIFLLKVSISCDDRPELFSELNSGLKSLKLRIVHAEIITIGGRVRNNLLVEAKENVEGGRIICNMNGLKHSLKVVLSRIATSWSTSNYRVKSKRQRFFLGLKSGFLSNCLITASDSHFNLT